MGTNGFVSATTDTDNIGVGPHGTLKRRVVFVIIKLVVNMVRLRLSYCVIFLLLVLCQVFYISILDNLDIEFQI